MWIGLNDQNIEATFQFVSGASTSYVANNGVSLWLGGSPDNAGTSENVVAVNNADKVSNTCSATVCDSAACRHAGPKAAASTAIATVLRLCSLFCVPFPAVVIRVCC